MTEAASERGLPGVGLGGVFQIRRRCWAANQARAAPALGHRQQRRRWRLWRWEPSKHTLNSFLIADFLLGSSCRQGCFHFLLPPPHNLPHPTPRKLHGSPPPNFQSVFISSLPSISLSFSFSSPSPLFFFYPSPLSPILINIHGARASLFPCGSLKVILLEALLSVPLTAWELKVLICIHKITREAQFARPAGEEKGEKRDLKKRD